ncbi:hypothetical protein SF1_37940 [Sphingobacterium faecium NBRC 15299]|uniref:hypothetical protein n=1 Tax=Sphingobacterium faecium TaxID=34087 RepID=UPI000D382773|nr:hypothetical protein [Sphingobacterium faecium]PTX12970.1 D-mannose binding lectin [Sphingobacterium faecium]GEM65812.1 hypothetical protein SF1_37940 [Sphingobacterium faecium NBRC 15299]
MIDLEYYKESIIRVNSIKSFPFDLKSPNGRFSLVGQSDGNLYLVDHSNDKVLWDAGSYKKYGSRYLYRMTFQKDGNLVIYANRNGLYDDSVWATGNLFVPNGDFFLSSVNSSMYILQDDGNLVLYFNLDGGNANIDTIVRIQPIAETRTWNGRKSTHWEQIK